MNLHHIVGFTSASAFNSLPPTIRKDHMNLGTVTFHSIHIPPSQATRHYIIVSDEGTSEKPRKHPTREAAEQEAERLARKHPGLNFVVYLAVSSKNTSVTPVNTLNFV